MSGYSRDELLSMSIGDLEASQSPLEIRQKITQVATRGQSRFQTRHRRKDGSFIDVEISTTSLQSAGTLLVFVRDVTQRTRDDARLQESMEFSRTILASLVDLIVILDRNGTILSINEAWERSALEKGGPDSLATCGVGVNYLKICGRAGAWNALEGIESVLRRRHGFYRSEYAAQAPSETRWYVMDVMPLRRSEGGAVVVHSDITERKRAEAELRQLRTENWHAHRVAQTGAIAASLAHELNQPLAAVLSNAQAGLRLLADRNPDLDEIRAILTDIVQDDKRAAAVIAGLRAMLRRRETQRERLDLADPVRDGLALAHSEFIANHVQVHLRVAPGCFVDADSAQLQQVVLNLVTNAVEAMHTRPPQQRRLEITLESTPEGNALIAVRDRGPGIPEDQQAKLFDSFWTTKPSGMGVGLPICRSIIESHGGHLWFANNEDQGATFFVSLPLASPTAQIRG
jgi:C4-dicarboxylate-specific signal transduction histidine kinase